MNNFSFQSPTRYVFGRGVEYKVGELTISMGCNNVLVVYGQGSAVRSGLLDRVVKSLEENGVACQLLGGVRPNPVDSTVRQGIAMCREHGIDGLVAVGGGSAIDTAKSIAVGVYCDVDFWDLYLGKARVTNALPLGVVLTIPAAGSEGSTSAVITNETDRQKLGLTGGDIMRPRFALLNPELTLTLPMSQTLAGISDMMAHIMERYFSPTQGVETTDRISEGLLMAIINEARRVVANPDDYDARANIMWSGTLAHNGLCGCGRDEEWSAHGLEHVLSALYDVAHGHGLSVAFPAWMTFAAQSRPEKIAQFGRRVFGVTAADDHTAALEGIQRLKDFYREVGLPVTLRELGITDADYQRFAADFHRDNGPVVGNYCPLSEADSEAIYRLME